MSYSPPSFLANRLKQLEILIAQQLQSDVPLVSEVAQYLVHAGGKRFRPQVLLLLHEAFLVEQAGRPAITASQQHAITLSAILEFIHTATLLHDDVVDGSALRRGRPTANQAFGNSASVLVGDFLYSRSFQMMVEVNRLDVMGILADATNTIASGEVLQLMRIGDTTMRETQYEDVIYRKTAKLFEAASCLAALLMADVLPDEAARATHWGAFGKHLGMAFQIADDCLDYVGDPDVTGKNIGDDLREGKLTLPLIYVLQQGSEADRKHVLSALEHAPNSDEAQFAQIAHDLVSLIQQSGALQYTQQTALRHCQAAQALLDELSPSLARQALFDLCAYAVGRHV